MKNLQFLGIHAFYTNEIFSLLTESRLFSWFFCEIFFVKFFINFLLSNFYLVEDIDGNAIIFSVSNPESFRKTINEFFDVFQFFIGFENDKIPLTTFSLTCFSSFVETKIRFYIARSMDWTVFKKRKINFGNYSIQSSKRSCQSLRSWLSVYDPAWKFTILTWNKRSLVEKDDHVMYMVLLRKTIRTGIKRSWLKAKEHLRKVYDHLLIIYDLSF